MLDIDAYATAWVILLIGAAFGAASAALVPKRGYAATLFALFLLLALFVRPLTQWLAAN